MKRKQHHHPCANAGAGCTHQLPCDDANLERNYDGFPEVVCRAYHDDSGRLNAVACADCQASTCKVCGAVTRLEGHDLDCAGTPMEAHA